MRRGITLVVVLWIVALLSVAVYAALFTARTEYSLAGTFEDEEKLKQIALSGIEYGIATLLEDTTPWDTLKDEWVESDALYKEVKLGEGFFSLVRPKSDGSPGFVYGIQDEASLFPLNFSAWEHLATIEGLDEPMAQAIVDWRDEDSEALPQGAEDSYYLGLSPGYKAKNAHFETVEELLYVKGITQPVLWGRDRNHNGSVDGSEVTDDMATSDYGVVRWVTPFTAEPNLDVMGQPRVNLNTASDQEIREVLQASFSPEKLQLVFDFKKQEKFQTVAQVCGLFQGNNHVNAPELKPVYDRLTVTEDKVLFGKINVNTAPEKVLRAVAGLIPQVMAQWPNGIIPPQNVREEDLKRWLQQRESGGPELASVSWMMGEPDTDPRFRTISPHLTTKSRQFRLDVIARLDGRPLFKRYRAMVDIDREAQKARILYFRDISQLFMQAWDAPGTLP